MRETAEARSRRIRKGRLDASPRRPSQSSSTNAPLRRGNGRDAEGCAGSPARDPDDFCGWLANGDAGQRTVYYRGHLGRDRCRSTTALSERDRQALIALARQALLAAEDGRVHLLQRRHGDGDYSYIAVKSAHGEAAPSGASQGSPIISGGADSSSIASNGACSRRRSRERPSGRRR